MKGAVHLEIFANASEQIPTHPELIPGIDANARSNLVLPLSWHDLPVGSRNVDIRIQTGTVMRLADGAAEHVLGSSATVVRSLGAREAARRPPEGGDLVEVEERVLLLHAKPHLLGLVLREKLGSEGSGVRLDGLASWGVAVTHYDNVFACVVCVMGDL